MIVDNHSGDDGVDGDGEGEEGLGLSIGPLNGCCCCAAVVDDGVCPAFCARLIKILLSGF